MIRGQQLLLGSVIAVARIEAVPEVVVGAVNGEVCCRGPRIAIAWSRRARLECRLTADAADRN